MKRLQKLFWWTPCLINTFVLLNEEGHGIPYKLCLIIFAALALSACIQSIKGNKDVSDFDKTMSNFFGLLGCIFFFLNCNFIASISWFFCAFGRTINTEEEANNKEKGNKEIKTNDMNKEDLETAIRTSPYLYKSYFIQNASDLEIYPNEVDQFYKLTNNHILCPIINNLDGCFDGYFDGTFKNEYFKLRNKFTGEEATVIENVYRNGFDIVIVYSQREVERKYLLEELEKKLPKYVNFQYDIEKEELMVWHEKSKVQIIPKTDLKNINNYLGEINNAEKEKQQEEQDKKYKLEYIKNGIHDIFNED